MLWWTDASPLTNSRISEAHNLDLFLNALGTEAKGIARPESVYWDEYFHGERMSLWVYAERTPVIWGLLQTTVLAMAVLFTLGRRSGPVLPVAAPSRLWPLEFVNTLGELYARARHSCRG